MRDSSAPVCYYCAIRRRRRGCCGAGSPARRAPMPLTLGGRPRRTTAMLVRRPCGVSVHACQPAFVPAFLLCLLQAGESRLENRLANLEVHATDALRAKVSGIGLSSACWAGEVSGS